MNRHIIQDVYNLEKGSGYLIGTFFYNEKNHEDNSYSICFDIDTNFMDGLMETDNVTQIMQVAYSIQATYKSEILELLKKSETNDIPLITVSVVADEEGPSVGLFCPFLGLYTDEKFNNTIEQIVADLKGISIKLSNRLEKVIDTFVEECEEKSFKRYELLFYRSNDGNIHYADFIRPGSGDISEYKHSLYKILNEDMKRKLIEEIQKIIKNTVDSNGNRLMCSFFTDGTNIYDMKLGKY